MAFIAYLLAAEYSVSQSHGLLSRPSDHLYVLIGAHDGNLARVEDVAASVDRDEKGQSHALVRGPLRSTGCPSSTHRLSRDPLGIDVTGVDPPFPTFTAE